MTRMSRITNLFIRELILKFYYVLMTYYPETAHQSFKDKYRDLQWSYNKRKFQFMERRKAGFPIIDAAMGELNTTGYMHNRMRMVVSQFLTKDLFIDWTWGEEYFDKNSLIMILLQMCTVGNGRLQLAQMRCLILECLIQ